MRVVSAFLIVLAAICLGVPAHADPSGDDADFLARLKRAGISYTNGDRAVTVGKGICDRLDHGQSVTDVVNNLTDANREFPPNNAAKFTAIAAGAYCPKYLGIGSDGAAGGGGQTVNDGDGSGDGGGGGPGGG